MNTTTRSLSLAFALCSVPLIAAAEAPTPAEVAGTVERFYKERVDVRARFTQKVKKPGRRRVLTKQGLVFFKRPGMMRWEYKKPEPVFYISDGKVLWSYQPEDKLVTRLDVSSSELYHQSRYLFGQGNLTQDFELSKGEAGEPGRYPLTLKPKRSSRNFKQLVLVVNPATGEILETRLTDPYDNLSTITFEKTQYKAVADKHFRFTPPQGATIRDLSKGGKAQ